MPDLVFPSTPVYWEAFLWVTFENNQSGHGSINGDVSIYGDVSKNEDAVSKNGDAVSIFGDGYIFSYLTSLFLL